jgi:hypothetical protein
VCCGKARFTLLCAKSGLMHRSKHCYSISSSARPISVFGTVMPSALAVLRLMTNSNLVACTAGNSIARLDNRLSAMAQPTSPQNNVLQITAVEAKSIREFLMKIDAFKPMVEAGHKVGDTIPEDQLLDFSALLTREVPKLKNTNYTIDQNGSIIIVSENRIVAILDFVNVAR